MNALPAIRLLGASDASVLLNVAPGVFDNAIDTRWTNEFLADPRHHMMVALQDGQVVGMASAVHYIHPDKPPEFWVNEIGVAPSYRNQGIGKRLFRNSGTTGDGNSRTGSRPWLNWKSTFS